MKYYAILIAFLFALTPTAHATGQPNTACNDLYQPVCASHQVQCIKAPCYPVYTTYSNTCAMNAAGSTFIHAGACTESETGPVKPAEPELPWTPPATCVAWFDGCNSCSRETPTSPAMCTLMACINKANAAPYCKTYASTTTEPTKPVPPPTVSTSTPAGTTTPEAEAHLFVQILTLIRDWFAHLIGK